MRPSNGTPDARIVERDAVRAIVISDAQEVLLLRIRAPEGDWFWITPGGGLEEGEHPEAGLRRELKEELGLEHFELGPLVWRRQHTFNWGGKRICQREHYHVLHVDRFEPTMSDEAEASWLDRFQWWPVGDLARAQERLTPLSLAEIVQRYLTDGPPTEPLEVEILVN
jgi:8-oxo-dGTP pyrophosphatase MutT (NUDIX family)